MRWLFFMSLFSLSSCISSNITGLYGECEPGYLSCSQLLIHSDSTYSYYEYWDVGGSGNVIDGYWKKHGDTLLLTSFIQREPCKFQVETSPPYLHSKIGIKVIDESGQPVSNLIFKVYSKGELEVQISDVNGFSQIEKLKSIDSIRVSSLGFPICDSLFIMNEMKIMDYTFKQKYSYVNITMKDDPWLIKGKKVYFYQDSNGRFDKSIYKKKTTLDKKVF